MNNDVTLKIELPSGVTVPSKTTLASGTQINNTLEMECYTSNLCQNSTPENFNTVTLEFRGFLNPTLNPQLIEPN